MIGFADRVDSASSPDTNGTSVIGFADQVVWNRNDSQTRNVISFADQDNKIVVQSRSNGKVIGFADQVDSLSSPDTNAIL